MQASFKLVLTFFRQEKFLAFPPLLFYPTQNFIYQSVVMFDQYSGTF